MFTSDLGLDVEMVSYHEFDKDARSHLLARDDPFLGEEE